MKSEGRLYGSPKVVDNAEECSFYHTMDLPGHGVVQGQWDLRRNVDEYLGRVDLKGKRVLEVGTASGFLCFEMEKRGAEVVGYDLSENEDWDVVPFGGRVDEDEATERKKLIHALNNGWWMAHRLNGSNARVVYGSVYAIPEAIGPVDVVTFGSILLHLRDPFLALQRGCALCRETVIVTDVVTDLTKPVEWGPVYRMKKAMRRLFGPVMRRDTSSVTFLPDPERQRPRDTWWHLPPLTICRFLQVLGFPKTDVTYHIQPYITGGREVKLFTVVGRR